MSIQQQSQETVHHFWARFLLVKDKVKDCRDEDAISAFRKNCLNEGILNAINRRRILHFADLATIVQKYSAMESAWKDQAACWEPSVPTQPQVQAKRAHSRDTPSLIAKKHKPITRHGTVLEGWLDGPWKIHTTPDTIPTHSLRACWILRQVAKSGEGILTKNTLEQHPPEDDDPKVLTVFETFTSNNKRKRALRGLAEVCQIATVNPWNDTAITFNAGDEAQYKTG